ncbi:hypothetical protein D3C80_2238090 [compost metagenome]
MTIVIHQRLARTQRETRMVHEQGEIMILLPQDLSAVIEIFAGNVGTSHLKMII